MPGALSIGATFSAFRTAGSHTGKPDMSDTDRSRWNQRYREGSYRSRTHPTPLLEQWLPELPRGRALDVACGTGRNTLYLAGKGYAVDAVDISMEALARARGKPGADNPCIRWIEADLDEFAPPASRYDLMVVARFVSRLLLPGLPGALKPGGALLYEHHIISDEPVAGPRDTAFRLAPGELRSCFHTLDIRFYREGLVRDPDGRIMALAQMIAFRAGP